MAVLGEMVAAVDAQESPPQGMFVVGSGVDIASVKEHLADLVAIPVNAPEESGLALARGAALAAANAPPFDATTRRGLPTHWTPTVRPLATVVGLANAATQMAPRQSIPSRSAPTRFVTSTSIRRGCRAAEEGRKPFLLVGSALTAIFVIGVVGLVISLAVSIRPDCRQRPDAGQARSSRAPLPLAPPVQEAIPKVQVPPGAAAAGDHQGPDPGRPAGPRPAATVYVAAPPRLLLPPLPPPAAAPPPPPRHPAGVPPVVPPPRDPAAGLQPPADLFRRAALPADLPAAVRCRRPRGIRRSTRIIRSSTRSTPRRRSSPQYPPQQQYPQYPQQARLRRVRVPMTVATAAATVAGVVAAVAEAAVAVARTAAYCSSDLGGGR